MEARRKTHLMARTNFFFFFRDAQGLCSGLAAGSNGGEGRECLHFKLETGTWVPENGKFVQHVWLPWCPPADGAGVAPPQRPRPGLRHTRKARRLDTGLEQTGSSW